MFDFVFNILKKFFLRNSFLFNFYSVILLIRISSFLDVINLRFVQSIEKCRFKNFQNQRFLTVCQKTLVLKITKSTFFDSLYKNVGFENYKINVF